MCADVITRGPFLADAYHHTKRRAAVRQRQGDAVSLGDGGAGRDRLVRMRRGRGPARPDPTRAGRWGLQ